MRKIFLLFALLAGPLWSAPGALPVTLYGPFYPLPAGTNNIGDVDVLTLPALPAGGNTIGTVNLGTLNGAALDSTLTGGTQKAISRGGAKGATSSADITSTAEGADHQAQDVQLYHSGSAIDPRTITSLPALPAGNNNIGDVDIVTLPAVSLSAGQTINIGSTGTVGLSAGTTVNIGSTGTVAIGSALPAGTNGIGKLTANSGVNIGSMDVLTLPALPAGTNAFGKLSAQSAAGVMVGDVSLGNSLGKVNKLQTGQLTTTATTADQVILTYTVTSGKTLYLEYVSFDARLTTYAATATHFGDVSLETPSGTKTLTLPVMGIGQSGPIAFFFPEPIPIAATVVVRLVVTPTAVTSFKWYGNIGGYEK